MAEKRLNNVKEATPEAAGEQGYSYSMDEVQMLLVPDRCADHNMSDPSFG